MDAARSSVIDGGATVGWPILVVIGRALVNGRIAYPQGGQRHTARQLGQTTMIAEMRWLSCKPRVVGPMQEGGLGVSC
jgi:hypothetical protein